MSQTASNPERRSVLQRLSTLLLGLIGGVLGAPAALFLFDPVRRRQKIDSGLLPQVPVARLSDVPDIDKGGQPMRTTVVARTLHDAWNRLENVRQGSVWLYRRSGELLCLSTVCPHAGCAIDFDEKRHGFVCPCHGSVFALDGTRREGPSPRDMDTIETEVKDGRVLCRYQRFRLAVSRKETI